MKTIISLVIGLMTASLANASEINRPIISSLNQDEGTLYLQGDYMSPSLDPTNYSQKLPAGSATLDYYRSINAGIHYAATDELILLYHVGRNNQRSLRTTEPKVIESQISSYKLGAQYIFYAGPKMRAAIELGYTSDKAKNENFYRYDFQGINVTIANGLPLVSLAAKDHAWTGAVRSSYQLSNNFSLYLSGELKRYTVSANMSSVSPIIMSLLASQAPQSTPWNEYHTSLALGADWHPIKPLLLSMDYTAIQINRQGYIPRAGKVDYNTAQWLDGYLAWDFGEGISAYGHGRIMDHFLLGDMPLLYNTRTNHRFNTMFGYLSAGVAYQF